MRHEPVHRAHRVRIPSVRRLRPHYFRRSPTRRQHRFQKRRRARGRSSIHPQDQRLIQGIFRNPRCVLAPAIRISRPQQIRIRRQSLHQLALPRHKSRWKHKRHPQPGIHRLSRERQPDHPKREPIRLRPRTLHLDNQSPQRRRSEQHPFQKCIHLIRNLFFGFTARKRPRSHLDMQPNLRSLGHALHRLRLFRQSTGRTLRAAQIERHPRQHNHFPRNITLFRGLQSRGQTLVRRNRHRRPRQPSFRRQRQKKKDEENDQSENPLQLSDSRQEQRCRAKRQFHENKVP